MTGVQTCALPISRAVGAAEELIVDTIGGTHQINDLFLLASDGLTRLLGEQELLAVLSANSLEVAADRLLELALERGAPDNVSFVIVRAG